MTCRHDSLKKGSGIQRGQDTAGEPKGRGSYNRAEKDNEGNAVKTQPKSQKAEAAITGPKKTIKAILLRHSRKESRS